MKNRYKIKEEWGMGQYRLEGISIGENLDVRFTRVEGVYHLINSSESGWDEIRLWRDSTIVQVIKRDPFLRIMAVLSI